MLEIPRNRFLLSPEYTKVFRDVGISAANIFKHPGIKVWRKLPDRENCTLDIDLPGGKRLRLHIKRFQAARGFTTPAQDESRGFAALNVEKIPTAKFCGWGKLLDGRSFVVTEDLAGYQPADKLVETGTSFETLLIPTADLAGKLHRVGLHHRDLYLCHFFAKIQGEDVDLRLIDAARVKRLPGVLTRQRWIVKDLAQFWYSTTKLKITDEQRSRWLERYVAARKLDAKSVVKLKKSIERKSAWIARHDAKLNQKQPARNVSIKH